MVDLIGNLFYAIPVAIIILIIAGKKSGKKTLIPILIAILSSIFITISGIIVMAMSALVLAGGGQSLLNTDFGYNIAFPAALFCAEFILLVVLNKFKLTQYSRKALFLYSLIPAVFVLSTFIIPFHIENARYYREQEVEQQRITSLKSNIDQINFSNPTFEYRKNKAVSGDLYTGHRLVAAINVSENLTREEFNELFNFDIDGPKPGAHICNTNQKYFQDNTAIEFVVFNKSESRYNYPTISKSGNILILEVRYTHKCSFQNLNELLNRNLVITRKDGQVHQSFQITGINTITPAM